MAYQFLTDVQDLVSKYCSRDSVATPQLKIPGRRKLDSRFLRATRSSDKLGLAQEDALDLQLRIVWPLLAVPALRSDTLGMHRLCLYVLLTLQSLAQYLGHPFSLSWGGIWLIVSLDASIHSYEAQSPCFHHSSLGCLQLHKRSRWVVKILLRLSLLSFSGNICIRLSQTKPIACAKGILQLKSWSSSIVPEPSIHAYTTLHWRASSTTLKDLRLARPLLTCQGFLLQGHNYNESWLPRQKHTRGFMRNTLCAFAH